MGLWIYLIATWKPSAGLYLYYNYMLKVTDSTGTTIEGADLNEANPNFCIGRNLHGPTFSYGQFQISSFTTFNSFVPDTDIINIFLFFWNSGEF